MKFLDVIRLLRDEKSWNHRQMNDISFLEHKDGYFFFTSVRYVSLIYLHKDFFKTPSSTVYKSSFLAWLLLVFFVRRLVKKSGPPVRITEEELLINLRVQMHEDAKQKRLARPNDRTML